MSAAAKWVDDGDHDLQLRSKPMRWSMSAMAATEAVVSISDDALGPENGGNVDTPRAPRRRHPGGPT